ncbi:MAG: tetratricopeptide repeat protein [Gammaproteobacteria bacterium]|nr:tetratricopeptide repeat protein [Gammaproteobacteria bacterium]
MRLVIYSILVLIGATLITQFSIEDAGYAVISIHGWTLETSAIVFFILCLLLFVAAYFCLRLWVAIGLAPKQFRKWRERRRAISGYQYLSQGFLELDSGKWFDAEKHLLKAARNPHLAVLSHLGAARAAHEQGARNRRDGYYKLALEHAPEAHMSILLNQAQLLQHSGQPEKALAVLEHMPGSLLNSPQVLRSLTTLYAETKNWTALVGLLPRLRQYKALPMDDYYRIERGAYLGHLQQIGRSRNINTILNLWKEIPTRLQEDEALFIEMVTALMNIGEADRAEDMLYRRINHQWNEKLVYLYGLLNGDAEIHLSRGRNWLGKNPNNSTLLLTLGRLAMRAHDWQAAQGYLEKSLEQLPNAETYQELGNLLFQLNAPERAADCYRRGLAMTKDLSTPEIKTGVIEHLQGRI